MTEAFYDQLAPIYTMFYEDWERSLQRQARILDEVIREAFPAGVSTILDAACGIGTQSLGLAALGYRVTASDLSALAVDRARSEAARRGLALSFGAADMRDLSQYGAHTRAQFDLVIACDNAIPHLLSEADIRAAFREFYRVTTPQGGCIISIRDYAAMETPASGRLLEPRRVVDTPAGKRVLVELREFSGSTYTMTMYVTEDTGADVLTTQAIRGGTYFCVTIDVLERLMREAGFPQVITLRDRLHQPVMVGKKAS